MGRADYRGTIPSIPGSHTTCHSFSSFFFVVLGTLKLSNLARRTNYLINTEEFEVFSIEEFTSGLLKFQFSLLTSPFLLLKFDFSFLTSYFSNLNSRFSNFTSQLSNLNSQHSNLKYFDFPLITPKISILKFSFSILFTFQTSILI